MGVEVSRRTQARHLECPKCRGWFAGSKGWSAESKQLTPKPRETSGSWVSAQGTWQGLYGCWSRLRWSSGVVPVELWGQSVAVSKTGDRVYLAEETGRRELSPALVGFLSARPTDPWQKQGVEAVC